jgi:hypothetical protein
MASPESLKHDVEAKAEEINQFPLAPIVEQQQQLSFDGLPSVAEGASPNPIYEDLREYELDDQECTVIGSGSASDTSGTSDFSEEEDLEEFPFREGRRTYLSEIWVTTTVTVESTPIDQIPPLSRKMPNPNVPKPGPAKLPAKAGLAEWLSEAKQCHYLPETVMKQLCEMVKECLMEGEFYILAVVAKNLLTLPYRVQYPACLHSSHDLR